MANSENGGSNKQAGSDNVHEEANIYEDEINLMDYFLVLWKRKWFIFLASVLPALIVGLVFFFSPRSYEVTYIYDVYDVRGDVRGDVSSWSLNEKNYNILISRIYSEENMDKIASKLRENDLNEYAEQLLNAANSPDALKNLLKFEPIPPYIDLSTAKVTNPEQLEQIRELTAQLLNMTIIGKPKEDLAKIGLVIRDNFEKVVPIYSIERQVTNAINGYRSQMAGIEANRFSLDLLLKTNKAVLERLKKIEIGIPDKGEDNVMLQFDVGSKSEYLPLGYQVRAAEAKIVEFEEQIRTNSENYDYYAHLLKLNEKLISYVKKVMPSYCTLEQFHSFLTNTLAEYNENEQQLLDYLKAYIKRIENKIANVIPLVEKPKVYPVAKGTVKKSAIVFVIALMMSVFASFLLEGLKKAKAQAS